jgi:hypothetical protein
MSWPALRWGELPIFGFEALRELYEGLLERLMGGPLSEVDDKV